MALRRSIYTYLLRTCDPNGESYGGFKWPLKKGAIVKAPDWSPKKQCGNGLHGLLMGEGAGELLNWEPDAKWLVVRVRRAQVVTIDNEKVKVPSASIVYVGERGGAIDLLLKLGADPSKMVAGQPSASGDYGQASASGTRGQASASGDYGQASASGTRGQASASGTRGQASASGYQGQASASGYQGQASASKSGIAQSRYRVKSGELGILIGLYSDGIRDRVLVGYVGENGILAKTWYVIVVTSAGATFLPDTNQSDPAPNVTPTSTTKAS